LKTYSRSKVWHLAVCVSAEGSTIVCCLSVFNTKNMKELILFSLRLTAEAVTAYWLYSIYDRFEFHHRVYNRFSIDTPNLTYGQFNSILLTVSILCLSAWAIAEQYLNPLAW